jgi:hypothetical protein
MLDSSLLGMSLPIVQDITEVQGHRRKDFSLLTPNKSKNLEGIPLTVEPSVTFRLLLTFFSLALRKTSTPLSIMEDSKSVPPGMRDPSRRVLINSGLNDKITIEKYGTETNGEYSFIRCWTYPGGGTPVRRSSCCLTTISKDAESENLVSR